MSTYNVPAVLAALCGLRRPHGGTGETLAREIVKEQARKAGFDPLQDAHGNVEVRVGPVSAHGTVFTAHLDTVHRIDGQQHLCILGDTVRECELLAEGPDGKPSVLGADDAAGVYLLTEMLHAGIPGRYLFFVGEEVGGIGSSAFVQDHPDFSANMVVSFDRKGTSDVITMQGGYVTASNTFALALAGQLNQLGLTYKPCDGGMYTDSKEFAGLVPECTNISVGYQNEHTVYESLDLLHLQALRDVLMLVDWESLPIARIPEPDLPWQVMERAGGYGAWGFTTRNEMLRELTKIEVLHESGALRPDTLTEFLRFTRDYVE